MNKRAAAQYLTKLFGDRQGYVAVAYKDESQKEPWKEKQFEWPADKVKIIAWAADNQGANIFICPALRVHPARDQGDGTGMRWLWADVDMDKVPKDKRAEVQQRISEIGTYVVASGSADNRHVYTQLDSEVNAAEHLRLNTGLRDYLYADNKQADNSLLRLPGTTNWKTAEGSVVTVAGGTGGVVPQTQLMALRAFSRVSVGALDTGVTAPWKQADVSGVSRRIMRMAQMSTDQAVARYGNRHKAVWGIAGELHKRGLDADMIHTLMEDFPAAVSKAHDERGYDVHKDVDKRLLWDLRNAPPITDDEVDDDAGEMFQELSVEQMTDSLISEGVQKELLRRAIRRSADMAEAASGHVQPPADTSYSLSDALSNPPEPTQYLIDGLVSADAIVVIVGQYKTGKTKLMVSSLITSLADDEPFLGAKQVYVPEGGAVVGHWNLEMSSLDLVDKYMRPANFKNPHNVHLANWQGYRLNILTEPGKRAAIEWLTTRRVRVWTIDSWSALCRMCGVDPNDGSAVGQLMAAVIEIKVEAEVQAVFMLAHIARSSAESDKPGTKGASEVDAMVDTRWMFTVDKSEIRWLSAEGRGTQMSALSLDFNEDTGRSTIGAVTRQSAAQDGMVQLIVRTVKDRPGINQGDLVKLVKEVNHRGVQSIKDGIKDAEDGGWIRVEEAPGISGRGRNQQLHFLTNDKNEEGDRRKNATIREVNLSVVDIRRRASK